MKAYITYFTELCIWINKLEVTAMVCSNLLTSPHLTNETRQGQQHDAKSELSKMQRENNLFIHHNPVCNCRMHASFCEFLFFPSVSNSLPCSSRGLNEAPRHIPEQGRWYTPDHAPVHNAETKKLLNLLTAETVYNWSSHSMRSAKADKSTTHVQNTHGKLCTSLHS